MKNNLILGTVSALFFTSAFIAPVHANSIDGVIKGAECHLYGKFCSTQKNDPREEFERDFVLVSGDQYYVLDDLPLKQKRQLNNRSVRISGDVDMQRIAVTRVKIQNGDGNYQNVWDWEEISYQLYEN